MADRMAAIQRAIDSFKMEEARALAQEELAENPSADAYYLASQAALNHGQRVEYLEKTLELDPDYQAAREELADMKPPKMADRAEEEPAAAPKIILASLARRFAAIVFDGFIVAIATLLVVAAGDALTPLNEAILSNDELALSAAISQFQSDTIVVNLVVSAIYNVVLMKVFNGQTLGKMIFKLRVVKKNGRRITILDALLRNVVGYTISQILLLGYLWALLDKDKQAWHDKMAGTVVILERHLPKQA